MVAPATPDLVTLERPGRLGLRRSVRIDRAVAEACESVLGPDWMLDPVAALERSPLAQRLSHRRNRSLYRVEKLTPDGTALYWKHQAYPLPGRLFTWILGPWGRRELDALLTLRSLGMATFTPVLGGVAERGPFVHESFIATLAIEGGVNLSSWRKDRSGDARSLLPDDELRDALPPLWENLARLHRRRFYARTLLAKNVLAYRDESGELVLALHDLPRPRLRPGRTLSLRLAVYDLACLEKWAVHWLEPDERRTLLHRYLAVLGEGPPAEVWERRLERRTAALLRETLPAHLRHRGRRTLKSLPGIGHWFR